MVFWWYWSALATAPAETSVVAKEAIEMNQKILKYNRPAPEYNRPAPLTKNSLEGDKLRFWNFA